MKKLSIITVNLNNAAGLEKTMESVFEQTFRDYEYIVIDGASADGSKELIKKHENKLVYWSSEKDNGIYAAMNKAILKANGEYLQFLNSGDIYHDGSSLASIFSRNIEADIVYANYASLQSGSVYYMPVELSFRFFYKQSVNHQATLIKSSLFSKYGLYAEDTPIIADWQFFIRVIFLHGATTQHIPITFIDFDFNDSMSNKPGNRKLIKDTRAQILEKYFPLIKKDMEYIDSVENSKTFTLLKKIIKLRSVFK